jgi:TM2 domain-containing membrane protein YozV
VKLFVLITATCLALSAPAQLMDSRVGKLFFEETSPGNYEFRLNDEMGDSDNETKTRLTAIVLDVTLGVFGMHRLYLGTDVKVPVFYTLTLGGGMVLWVVDLGFLIFSDDLSRFKDNPNVFMWTDKK